MKKATRPLLIIGTVWMILVCGCAFLSLFRPGIATRWRQEPAPPEALSRLALGETGEVIGYSSDGAMYEFNYGSYSDSSSWEKVTEPSGVAAIGEGCVSGKSNNIVLPPPGKVKSRVSENCVHIESAYHLEVALLENGDVWSWENERYAYTELFIMSVLAIACVIGTLILLTGAGLWMYQKVKRTD